MNRKPKIKLGDLWSKVDFNRFSTWSLLFSNVVVILFAVVDKLSAVEVLWVYWIQSVIIGIFNFIRIITLKNFTTEGFKRNGKVLPNTNAAKYSTGIFFLFHYGFFHFIYATFLGGFSSFSNAANSNISIEYLILSAIIFFVSYLMEFIQGFQKTDQETVNLGAVMFAPYARIIPMHFTIIFGGFIGAIGSFFSTNTNVAVIILFFGIKTLVDLISHSIDFLSFTKTAKEQTA